MIGHRTHEFTEHFFRDGTVPTAGNSGSIFAKTITGSGPPTAVYKGVAGANGVLELALEATSEVQNVCVSMADKLHFDIDQLLSVEFVARLSTALSTTATTMVAFGMTGNRNDTIDSIAQALLFRVLGNGSAAVVVESDDGTTDNDDVATGITLADTWKRFVINFENGTRDVRFFGGGPRGLVPIGGGTTFNMSAYTSGLQFFAQIQKAANTDVGTLQIDRFTVRFRE